MFLSVEEAGSDYEDTADTGAVSSEQQSSDSDSDFQLRPRLRTGQAKEMGNYSCVICSDRFGEFSCMIRHIMKLHKDVVKSMKQCEVCGMRVLTEKLMEKHVAREHQDKSTSTTTHF